MHDATLHVRQVNRAASDLRRGIPVILSGDTDLAILAVETSSVDTLVEFESLSDDQSHLLMSRTRAAAVIQDFASFDSEVALAKILTPVHRAKIYQALANPVMPQNTIGIQLVEGSSSLATAALKLTKIANLLPVVLVKTITSDVDSLGKRHNIIKLSADDFLLHGVNEAVALQQVAIAAVPISDAPNSRFIAFRSHATALEHIAILIGRPELSDAPLVRIHSECFTGDLLASMRCDCGEQLRGAVRRMAEDGSGILLYLAQEGRGIGLVNKLRAYGLQDQGLDTLDANQALGWEADERNFFTGANMLNILGIKRIRLLTNNPQKIAAMVASNITVIRREPHLFTPNGINDEYIATKAARFDHWLEE